jgi:hypothetical protein
MGHIGVRGLQAAVNGLPLDDSSHASCEICAHANIRRSPFPTNATNRATHLLEPVHCDICGPLPNCYGNFSYFILFIDNYSRFITLFLMKTRNEALTLFTEYRMAAETHFGQKLSILHVNNAPELIHGDMKNFCKSNGITYEKTVPDSPPQNGVAECTNLRLCSMARAMLIDANLRDFFWLLAVLTATHIKQRVPHASLPPNKTPFELWFNHRPNLSYLRPFGTPCTACIITNHASKFQPRGGSGRFFSYAKDAKGYLIWVTNPHGNGGTLKIRRDVIFHNFPCPQPSPALPAVYRPLWEHVEFPDHLNYERDQTTPKTTLCMFVLV